MNGLSIAGRKINTGTDFYQTPSWATEALLTKEVFEGEIFEPCSGAGAISRVLETKYKVQSSDIRTDENVYGQKGKDFLFFTNDVDNIVTNPPYINAEQIIRQALFITTKKVAMLLKLTFLESDKRKDLFKNFPLKTVYVFRKRITMYPEGIPEPKNSGTITYAWFIWDKQYKGKPYIDWL